MSPVEAVITAPAGGTVIVSKWLIHTGWCTGWAALNSTPSPTTSRSVRPYSPRPVRATSPPRSRASSWAP